MIKTVLLFVCLLFVLTGCATTRAPQSETQLLERHVADLEGRLDETNRDMAELKGHLQFIKSDMKINERQPVEKKYAPVKRIPSLTDKQIQQALKNAGYYKGVMDGKAGPKTVEAVKKFQKANGLKADGVPGPVTQDRLNAYLKKRK